MSSASIDKFREAGRIAAHCRRLAAERIKPGVTIREVTEGIEAEIRRLGAEPGFPAQSSRNYVAAHYCSPPDDTQRYEVGDCVKVDLGVHVDGYIADTALTVDLSIDGRWHALIQSSAKALEAAIATVGPGVPVHEVGAAIERAITERGFKPVRNLTGHGLARWLVHCAPQIPNVGDHGDAVLREGQVIAIEPFATDGRGYIQEEGPSEVWMQARARRPPRHEGRRPRGRRRDREVERPPHRAALLPRVRPARRRRDDPPPREERRLERLPASRREEGRHGRADGALDADHEGRRRGADALNDEPPPSRAGRRGEGGRAPRGLVDQRDAARGRRPRSSPLLDGSQVA
jgi:methionyl aminopeptidase